MKSKINTVKKEKEIVGVKTLIERIKTVKRGMKPIKTSKGEIDVIVRKFLREINKSLIAGEKVQLVGSFTLNTIMRQSRTSFNFHTRKKQTIPARRTPKISFSQTLKSQIREKK